MLTFVAMEGMVTRMVVFLLRTGGLMGILPTLKEGHPQPRPNALQVLVDPHLRHNLSRVGGLTAWLTAACGA